MGLFAACSQYRPNPSPTSLLPRSHISTGCTCRRYSVEVEDLHSRCPLKIVLWFAMNPKVSLSIVVVLTLKFQSFLCIACFCTICLRTFWQDYLLAPSHDFWSEAFGTLGTFSHGRMFPDYTLVEKTTFNPLLHFQKYKLALKTLCIRHQGDPSGHPDPPARFEHKFAGDSGRIP